MCKLYIGGQWDGRIHNFTTVKDKDINNSSTIINMNKNKNKDQNKSLDEYEFCCSTPKNLTATYLTNWRNTDVIADFTALDSNWLHHIGWINLFNLTLSLCDLHVENKKGSDCTHYMYTPTSFDLLWYEMYRSLYHLMHRQFPPITHL